MFDGSSRYPSARPDCPSVIDEDYDSQFLRLPVFFSHQFLFFIEYSHGSWIMSAPAAMNGHQGHRQPLNGVVAERSKNNSRAGWVVQKFGGTSVGKFAVNIAEDIVK
jgi:hypothetical protein